MLHLLTACQLGFADAVNIIQGSRIFTSLIYGLLHLSRIEKTFSYRVRLNCSHIGRHYAWSGGWIALDPWLVSWASEPLSLTWDRGLLVDAVWLRCWVPSLCFIQKPPTRSKQLSLFPNYTPTPSCIVNPCTAVVSLSLNETSEGLILSIASLFRIGRLLHASVNIYIIILFHEL